MSVVVKRSGSSLVPGGRRADPPVRAGFVVWKIRVVETKKYGGYKTPFPLSGCS